MSDGGSSDALGLHLPNPNADKANAQNGKSLEVLLAVKNKKILEELTRFRVRKCHGVSGCVPADVWRQDPAW